MFNINQNWIGNPSYGSAVSSLEIQNMRIEPTTANIQQIIRSILIIEDRADNMTEYVLPKYFPIMPRKATKSIKQCYTGTGDTDDSIGMEWSIQWVVMWWNDDKFWKWKYDKILIAAYHETPMENVMNMRREWSYIVMEWKLIFHFMRLKIRWKSNIRFSHNEFAGDTICLDYFYDADGVGRIQISEMKSVWDFIYPWKDK